MSTKIGIIAEGSIDHVLLPALLTRIAQDRAGFSWPLDATDVAEWFFLRKRGHGGVLEAVRNLVRALDNAQYDHDCFVILLDRRTRAVQEKVRRLISGRKRFVLGIAIEEIEAWWLGDRTNTCAWAGFPHHLPQGCCYGRRDYNAERDRDPKGTLDELTRLSDRFDRVYGEGSVDLAAEFAEDYWAKGARLSEIATHCPKGFGAFERNMSDCFREIKRASGRLF